MAIPKEQLLKMYRNIVTARLLDGKVYELFSAGKCDDAHFAHRRPGEEAIPISISAVLNKDDYFKPNQFSGLAASCGRGIPLRDIIATTMSKDPSMYGGAYTQFCPDEYGILGYEFSIGELFPIALGTALSAQILKNGRVTVSIIGDGGSNRGPIHESMVMAAMWNLPIVFGIQDNKYGIHTRSSKVYKIKDKSDRAKAYGFPGVTVDGNDVIACYEVVKEYVDRARSGGGPGLIVFDTYRLRGHSEGDRQEYRPKGEVEEWWKLDPLPRYQKRLMEMSLLTEADVSRIEAEAKDEIEKAAEEALAMSRPGANYLKLDATIVDGL